MAGRQRSTFQKRQKEIKRLEKQRDKAAKRAAQRLERAQRNTQEPLGSHSLPEDQEVSLTSDIPGRV